MVKRRIEKQFKRINTFFNKIKNIPYTVRRFYNIKKIKSRDFTIISNNCWAGRVYQYLDMPYLSPTVGLYFFSDDYLKFVSDLKHYISMDLEFISYAVSKYRDILKERHQENVPIGRLGDVEIVFLHYKSKEEALEKWNRRKERINFNHLIFKISNMNLCTEEHLKKFDKLPYNKIIINNRKKTVYDSEVYYYSKENKKSGPLNVDTNPFPGNIKLYRILR